MRDTRYPAKIFLCTKREVDIWLVAAGIYAKPFCEYIREINGIWI